MYNLIYAINIPSFVYWIIVAILAIVGLVVGLVLASKHINEKRKKDCFNLLEKICNNSKNDNYVLETVNNKEYDYYIETEKDKFYIKLINNPSNQEICVNNAIKWQLRRSMYEKEMRFVDGVENLMRLDLKNEGKTNHKIYIIYPNARALLKVINECEMVFINPTTDIYGARILTYRQLEEDNDLLGV